MERANRAVKDSAYYRRWAEMMRIVADEARNSTEQTKILRSMETYLLMARLLAMDEAIASIPWEDDEFRVSP